jgi:tetratricopeptide (TPR) repeat protein
MEMNKIYFWMVCLITASVFGQVNNEVVAFEKKVLEKAKQYNDISVVKSSMMRLVLLEGENSTYKDSLAFIYFQERAYPSSFIASQEVLKRDPNNVKMLEVQAFSLESIGAYDKAVESFKKLFAKTNNNYYGFSQANLQYVLKDYSGAYATLLQVEKLNDTGNYTVSYAINQTHKQEIELIAAIQYLKGLCAVQLKNNPVAKASFEKALTTQPDFVLAKEALENLQPK